MNNRAARDYTGNIINAKTFQDKIIYKIELTEAEARQLKNHIANIHMFSATLCNQDSKIIERGAKGRAKYFTIPLSLKSRKKKRYNKVSYQKIETEDKIFFICVIDKDPLY